MNGFGVAEVVKAIWKNTTNRQLLMQIILRGNNLNLNCPFRAWTPLYQPTRSLAVTTNQQRAPSIHSHKEANHNHCYPILYPKSFLSKCPCGFYSTHVGVLNLHIVVITYGNNGMATKNLLTRSWVRYLSGCCSLRDGTIDRKPEHRRKTRCQICFYPIQ